jgi:hypothetical protein
MKRLTLLLLLAVCIPRPAHADDASRRDKAKQLLILMHADRMAQQILDSMMKQTKTMTQQMVGGTVTPEQQAKLDDFQKKIYALVASQLSYASLEPDYIKLYASNFTDEDLDGMLAFYKSPAGQSMIEKMPALTAQSFQLAQSRMIILIPQIKQISQDFAKDCTDCKSVRPGTLPRTQN